MTGFARSPFDGHGVPRDRDFNAVSLQYRATQAQITNALHSRLVESSGAGSECIRAFEFENRGCACVCLLRERDQNGEQRGVNGATVLVSKGNSATARALIALLIAVLAVPIAGANGQELEPRSYVNTPIGLNFLLLGYGYSDGNVVFSASSPIEDAEVQTHAAILAYVRSVRIWDLSGKIGVVVPYAWSSGSALALGQPRSRDVSGFGDPRFRVSVNFFVAPPLTLNEFRSYKQDLIIGSTLEVTAPLGQYDSSKLLNIGTNRWSIRPEVGISKSLGQFTLELSTAVTIFTRNDDFLGGQTFEQAPLYSAQGHIVYEFLPGLWGALDATYYAGGRTTTNGVDGERLENARAGITLSFPVNLNNSIKLYGSSGFYSRTGTDFDALGIAWQVRWGGGL
jgi:hypothetical protein